MFLKHLRRKKTVVLVLAAASVNMANRTPMVSALQEIKQKRDIYSSRPNRESTNKNTSGNCTAKQQQ